MRQFRPERRPPQRGQREGRGPRGGREVGAGETGRVVHVHGQEQGAAHPAAASAAGREMYIIVTLLKHGCHPTYNTYVYSRTREVAVNVGICK